MKFYMQHECKVVTRVQITNSAPRARVILLSLIIYSSLLTSNCTPHMLLPILIVFLDFIFINFNILAMSIWLFLNRNMYILRKYQYKNYLTISSCTFKNSTYIFSFSANFCLFCSLSLSYSSCFESSFLWRSAILQDASRNLSVSQ